MLFLVLFIFFLYMIMIYFFFFFFQAEDGIRDYKVTGVQTCALPIYGKRVDVVAVTTKNADTLLLDRVTGKPIFPFRMRRAPTSDLPGEVTAPYQIGRASCRERV